MAEEISVEDIAKCCDIEEYDVKEALLYWADAGILMPKEAKETKKEEKKKTVSRNAKPSRADAARRGLEDEKIRYLLSATQIKLGRNLKSNETETLVWLYDDEGLDVSLILLIIQYAVEHKKANIRFIESVAVDWVNKGIDNITDKNTCKKSNYRHKNTIAYKIKEIKELHTNNLNLSERSVSE